VNDHVFAHPVRVRLVTEEGQRDSRIAPGVLDLLVHSQMGHHVINDN
jgi:hypothetical protein